MVCLNGRDPHTGGSPEGLEELFEGKGFIAATNLYEKVGILKHEHVYLC